ncbi:hypothetical protein [Hyalangium versicolor]|uniref:hypothetical protein n=1 Tax=Hyalangium versicolor TaxID=2861190 RepID=UPI001CCBFE78|nr:hypothetical protein [Hyalangium versicolor]
MSRFLCLALCLLGAPALSQPKAGWAPVGEFELPSGQARVSDPGYEKSSDFGVKVFAAKSGKWRAAIRRSYEKELGVRVAELMVLHDSVKPERILWTDSGLKVSVDSGTAGVFDDGRYRDDGLVTPQPQEKSAEPGESWYEKFVMGLYVKHVDAQTIPFGVVSSAGFGDGGYRCFVSYGLDKKVEAIRIVFIGDGAEGAEQRARVREIFRRGPFIQVP